MRDQTRSGKSGFLDADARPGDPYLFEGKKNPYLDLLAKWRTAPAKGKISAPPDAAATLRSFEEGFFGIG